MGIARFERFQNVEIAGTQYVLVQKLSGQLWQLRDARTNGIKESTCLSLTQSCETEKSTVHARVFRCSPMNITVPDSSDRIMTRSVARIVLHS